MIVKIAGIIIFSVSKLRTYGWGILEETNLFFSMILPVYPVENFAF